MATQDETPQIDAAKPEVGAPQRYAFNIYSTKFESFTQYEYLDEDDCLELFDELSNGSTVLSLDVVAAELQEQGKEYSVETLERALAIINPDNHSQIQRYNFPLFWFACSCFDARDCEYLLFLVNDEDREMGLTKPQYQSAMRSAGFALMESDVELVFARLADQKTRRIGYQQFHVVMEEFFRMFLAM